MLLQFPLKLLPTKKPVVSLNGRMVRPRAYVTAGLIGRAGASIEVAHLDPGSDDCVFPASLATKIGIDLSNAPIGEAVGIGTSPVTLRFARASLRLFSGADCCEWPAWIAFADASINRPLLGFAGCLEFFTTTYYGDRELVEMCPNDRFPGVFL
jgi:hypothetical protein